MYLDDDDDAMDAGFDDEEEDDEDGSEGEGKEETPQVKENPALYFGGRRVQPEDCAHLTCLIPRLPRPPVHTFTKMSGKDQYGLPQQLLVKDPVTGQNLAPNSTSSIGWTLKPYQIEGVNWCIFNFHQDRGCILAGWLLLSSFSRCVLTKFV